MFNFNKLMSTLHDAHMQAMAQLDVLFHRADRQADLDQAAREMADWDGGDTLPPLKPQDADGNWSD